MAKLLRSSDGVAINNIMKKNNSAISKLLRSSNGVAINNIMKKNNSYAGSAFNTIANKNNCLKDSLFNFKYKDILDDVEDLKESIYIPNITNKTSSLDNLLKVPAAEKIPQSEQEGVINLISLMEEMVGLLKKNDSSNGDNANNNKKVLLLTFFSLIIVLISLCASIYFSRESIKYSKEDMKSDEVWQMAQKEQNKEIIGALQNIRKDINITTSIDLSAVILEVKGE